MWFLFLAILCCVICPGLRADEKFSGKAIYLRQCATCHGTQGEGVADKCDEALYGNRPLAELVEVIETTMPEDKPELCTGKDAEAVGRYIYETFYTASARAKKRKWMSESSERSQEVGL